MLSQLADDTYTRDANVDGLNLAARLEAKRRQRHHASGGTPPPEQGKLRRSRTMRLGKATKRSGIALVMVVGSWHGC